MRGLLAYNLLAAVACTALGVWVYHEMQQPLPPLPAAVPPTAIIETGAGPEATAAPAFRMAPKNAYAQLVARPPFSPTRRPPRPKPVAAPAPVAQPAAPKEVAKPLAEPQATLVGIVIHADKSIAMVRKPGAAELLRLAKGETLDGWLVEGVLPDRLVLSHGDKLLELELTEATQSGSRAGSAPGSRPADARGGVPIAPSVARRRRFTTCTHRFLIA